MPLTIPDFLVEALRRPVAVLGGGVSGAAAAALVHALGGETVVYDAKGEKFGSEAAPRHGLVIFSPGFAPASAFSQMKCAQAVCGSRDAARARNDSVTDDEYSAKGSRASVSASGVVEGTALDATDARTAFKSVAQRDARTSD